MGQVPSEMGQAPCAMGQVPRAIRHVPCGTGPAPCKLSPAPWRMGHVENAPQVLSLSKERVLNAPSGRFSLGVEFIARSKHRHSSAAHTPPRAKRPKRRAGDSLRQYPYKPRARLGKRKCNFFLWPRRRLTAMPSLRELEEAYSDKTALDRRAAGRRRPRRQLPGAVRKK
jgi:hypothetical protein